MKTLTPLQQENLRRLQKEDSRIRGAFLSSCALLEAILSDCIASYFCSDENRKMLFYSEVLSGGTLMFRAKINLLSSILGAMNPSYSRKTDPLICGLDDLRIIRNRLAHCHLDTSIKALDEFSEGRFRIKFYQDGVAKIQVISQEDIQARLDHIHQTKLDLLGLLEKINGA